MNEVERGLERTSQADAFSRRRLLSAFGGLIVTPAVRYRGQSSTVQGGGITPFAPGVLPPGIRSRLVNDINGLSVHVLEAGFEVRNRPAIVLLHGFPELAYSWRKVMVPLAAAGYHVIAPDLRGYGRTTGWTADYDGDLSPFRMLNVIRDVLGLISALGYRSVAGVVGHD